MCCKCRKTESMERELANVTLYRSTHWLYFFCNMVLVQLCNCSSSASHIEVFKDEHEQKLASYNILPVIVAVNIVQFIFETSHPEHFLVAIFKLFGKG